MSAQRYRKKPVEVEAMQWSGSNWHEMLAWAQWEHHADVQPTSDGKLSIHTLEGEMTASPGDWVIRGVAGEFYPCKPVIFEQTYEPVVEIAGDERGP